MAPPRIEQKAMLPRPALCFVGGASPDGIESQHIDTYSPVTVESQNIYTKSGLDPSRDHRISVLFDTASFVSDRSQERFVDIHHFEYDDSGSSSGSGSGSSASTALIPSGSQSTLPLVSGSQRSTISGQTISPLSGGSQATTNTGALQSLHVSLGSQTGSVLASGGADLANVASTGGNQNQKLSPGAIIGVVFGALVLLLVTAIFLWFVRQKRRQNGAEFKHQEIPEMDEDKNLRTYQREPGMELQARSPVRSPARSTRSAESPHQSISRYPPLGPDHPHQTTSTLDLAVSPRETLPLPVHLSPWSPLYQHPFGQREEEQETEAEPYAESELETASRPGGGATGTSTPYAFEGAGSRKWQMMMNGSRSALNVNTNNANPTRLSPPRTPNTEYSGSGTRMSTMADRPSPMVDDFASSQSGRLVRRESLGFDSSVRGETPPPSYVQ
ncbi:hypothetical protein FRC17_008094 [Serendipita sp. 399]|nr:hypothetical protein FRC17_008094 [Serendipita sp. 399]